MKGGVRRTLARLIVASPVAAAVITGLYANWVATISFIGFFGGLILFFVGLIWAFNVFDEAHEHIEQKGR